MNKKYQLLIRKSESLIKKHLLVIKKYLLILGKHRVLIKNFFIIEIILIAIGVGIFLGLSQSTNNLNNNSKEIKSIFNNCLAIKNSGDESTQQYKFWHGIKNNNYNSSNNIKNYEPWSKSIIGEFYRADVGQITHVISNINLYTKNKYNDNIFKCKNILNPFGDSSQNNFYFTGDIFLIYCQAEIPNARNLPVFSTLIQVGKLKSDTIDKNIVMIIPGTKKVINNFAPNYHFVKAQSEKDLTNSNPNNFLINDYSMVILYLTEYINDVQNDYNRVFFNLQLGEAIKLNPTSLKKSDVSFDGSSNNYIINNIEDISDYQHPKLITIETVNKPKSIKDLLPDYWTTAFLNSGVSTVNIKKTSSDHDNILPVDNKQNKNVKTINDYFTSNGYNNISDAIKNATLLNNNFDKLPDNLFDVDLNKYINKTPVYSLFKYDNSVLIPESHFIVKIKGGKNYGDYTDDFQINNFKNGNKNNYYYFNLSLQNQFLHYKRLRNNQLKIIQLSGNDTDHEQNSGYLFLLIAKKNNYYNFYFISQELDNNKNQTGINLDDDLISIKCWLNIFYY